MPDYTGMNDLAIVPAPDGYGSYVELSDGRYPNARGRLFRKHLLTLGNLNYQGKTIKLDDSFYSRLKSNFDSGVSMVQVPIADARNKHTEDPLRNAGEVVGLERDGNKVYDVIDVRDPEVAQRLADGRIMGASAFLHMDYTDTRSGDRVGPALLHHCLTNRPHVVDLEPYQEIVAATADMDWQDTEPLVLAQEEVTLTREEMIAALRDEHGIDVEGLQAQASQQASAAQLTSQIVEALKGTGTVSLTGEGVDAETITGAIVELAATTRAQGEEITSLRTKDARREVKSFIDAGRLLPKAEERAVEMVLSGDREGLEFFLSPEKEPYVKLGHQQGIDPSGDNLRQETDVDQELVRLTSEHKSLFEKK